MIFFNDIYLDINFFTKVDIVLSQIKRELSLLNVSRILVLMLDFTNEILKSNFLLFRCFEFEATFPFDNIVTVSVWDWDMLGSDDMIGQTKIDIESRFYSKHRPSCGVALDYCPYVFLILKRQLL